MDGYNRGGVHQDSVVITPPAFSFQSQFGNAIAFSSDDNTVLVAAVNARGVADFSGTVYVFTRQGDGTWDRQATLNPTETDITGDTAVGDEFGYAVALSDDGNTALIGAPQDTVLGAFNGGSAYVFTRMGTTWTLQEKLVAGDRSGSDGFGSSVALSGDGNTAFVGAPNKLVVVNGEGAAYVFTRMGTTWMQQQRLVTDDGVGITPTQNAVFGTSVALSGDGNTAFVGAIGADGGNGAVYISTRTGTTWSQQVKLAGSQRGSYFGQSIVLSGNTALIGVPRANGNGISRIGAAYVFTGGGSSWSQQAILNAGSNAASDTRFGQSVALSGDIALVGAYLDNSPNTKAGSAYVFTRDGIAWSNGTKLTASDTAAASNQFGIWVALSGSVSSHVFAVIGSNRGDPVIGGNTCGNCGSAFIYQIKE